VRISPSTIDVVRGCFPDAGQVMELIGIIAVYNMVSRIVVGLEIPIERTSP
jgi:hypothetical protein